MKAIDTQYRVCRFCNHREPDRSESRCHEWEVEVSCGAQTKNGQIQLTSIWAVEDGVRYSWFQLSDDMRQEVFEALDVTNCEHICEAAVQAVAS